MRSTVPQRTTYLFSTQRERLKVSQHHCFHLKLFQKNYLKIFQKNHQARPQVYLNIAKVLDVSHKVAKALRKDMKGAIKPLHSTGIPSICSHHSQIVTFIYKRNTIMKKKIHLRLLQLVV